MTNHEEVLKGKYPAKAHAKKVADEIVRQGGDKTGTVYLEGQKSRYWEDNDEHAPFRQRRNFFYLSGCNVPDCYLAYHIESEKLTLFIPPIEPDDVIWSGLPLLPEEAMEKYDIDAVLTTDKVNSHLTSSDTAHTTLYAISNQVSDHITFLSYSSTNFDLLKPILETARVTKSPYEIALIHRANAISTEAHVAVMKAVSKAKNETELEALFLKSCIERGAKEQAYHGIVAAGENAATLHYVKNDASIPGKLNVLLDAGCQVSCYASDITRTFPVSGTFSKESSAIYSIVLEMQKRSIGMLRAGVRWEDVHTLAHKIAISGLLELGILRGGTADELFEARTSVAFFPHGLGHYLGMDTHDTGGNPDYADKDPMFRYLRVRGTLPADSVVTVEPGIYFCRFIIEKWLEDPKQKQYVDEQVLERYWSVGGVRIEDNILITENGCENLTSTPKEIDELKAIITGA
jgi:Xaa-Pro dipeptidase